MTAEEVRKDMQDNMTDIREDFGVAFNKDLLQQRLEDNTSLQQGTDLRVDADKARLCLYRVFEKLKVLIVLNGKIDEDKIRILLTMLENYKKNDNFEFELLELLGTHMEELS